MNLLIADNNDSFTWNLYQLCREAGAENIKVIRTGELGEKDIDNADRIIFSPGPGLPCEFPGMSRILENYRSKRILGVCLGMQAIGLHFGASLMNMDQVKHGRQEKIKVIKPDYIFQNTGECFEAGLYHSWVISQVNFPPFLEITAVSNNNKIMAIRHKSLDVRGVQFHPESFLTPAGKIILTNWINY